MYQTCVVTLGGPDVESCAIMKQTGVAENETLASHLEQKVQPYAATVTMTVVLLTSVVPAMVALFLGPWSDKFGRKPVIAIASTGKVNDSTDAYTNMLQNDWVKTSHVGRQSGYHDF